MSAVKANHFVLRIVSITNNRNMKKTVLLPIAAIVIATGGTNAQNFRVAEVAAFSAFL